MKSFPHLAHLSIGLFVAGLSIGVWPFSAQGARPLSAQKTLLTIPPTKAQTRNSEGDIIELKDGKLCLIYSRFTGGASDHAAADLARRESRDGGKSWGKDEIVVARRSGRNVMSVSLLRLRSGAIALFYLEFCKVPFDAVNIGVLGGKNSAMGCVIRRRTPDASYRRISTSCLGGGRAIRRSV